MTVAGGFNNPSAAIWYVQQIDNTGGGITYFWGNPSGTPINIQPNDVFRFAVQGAAGGHWYVLQNDNIIGSGALSDSPIVLTSGRVGMQLADDESPVQAGQVGIINFAAGSVTGSAPVVSNKVQIVVIDY